MSERNTQLEASHVTECGKIKRPDTKQKNVPCTNPKKGQRSVVSGDTTLSDYNSIKTSQCPEYAEGVAGLRENSLSRKCYKHSRCSFLGDGELSTEAISALQDAAAILARVDRRLRAQGIVIPTHFYDEQCHQTG